MCPGTDCTKKPSDSAHRGRPDLCQFDGDAGLGLLRVIPPCMPGVALQLDPAADNVNDVLALVVGELVALADTVGPLEARPAARAGGVLGAEDGVTAPWGLLAVFCRLRRRQSLADEVHGVGPYHVHAAERDELPLGCAQVKLGAERLAADQGQAGIESSAIGLHNQLASPGCPLRAAAR